MATASADLVGSHIRTWRARRRLSQLDLALDAEISARHLSFIETGRSRPSRAMLLRLAERLRIPPRERNVLLVAGGFAPALPARNLDDPALAAAREAVDKVLAAYEPYPALAVDLHWNLVAANAGIAPFLTDVAPHLLAPPVNVLRLSLHPEGLAPRIENLAEWRAYVFRRLEEQIDASADPVLAALLEELRAYPGGTGDFGEPNAPGAAPSLLPQHDDGVRDSDRHHLVRARGRGLPAGRFGNGGDFAGLKRKGANGGTR
jgi:transcriptional regulator with XRE-family HTH domain